MAASYLNAGNDVTVSAGNDLLVSGSDVNAGRNLDLSAVNNATINASQEQLDSETKSSFTRDGLTVTANHNIGQAIDAIGNIGKGDNAISNASEVMRAMDAMNNVAPSGSAFLGQTTTSDKQHTQQTTARGSNLNAGGDVTVDAGNTTNINATNVNAGRDIRITGTDVLIDDAQNTQTTNTLHDSQQVGVTLQATQGNASLTAGFSKAESDLEQVAVTTTGSTFTAGQDIDIHAINDLSITGSDLTAERNIRLHGENDVTVQAGQGYTTSQLDEEHLSAGAGINFGSNGIGFTAYVGAGENDLDRENVNHRNSHINAKDTLTVVSGNDTTISGANLLASNLDMNVGNNLHAESLQDTGSVDGKRWDASGSITVGAGVSGGASVGYGETDGSRAWVTEQTSLIGTESVNIKVGNHTQVDGAVIANIKDDGTDGGNLNLDTRTLAFKDLQDHDKEESNYLSIGFSTGGNPGANANTGASPDSEGSSWKVEGSHYELDREQTTRATIGQGNVTVRDDAETGSDSTSGLNRDTQFAQEVTKDKERDIDVYVSSTAIDSAKGLAASGDENTLNQWKDNVTSVVDPDAWGIVAENATDAVEDTYNVTSTVAMEKDLSIGNFWTALDDTHKITQLKNDLTRTSEGQALLEQLKSADPDERLAAQTALGHLAQQKFGINPSDIYFYDGTETDSESLQSNLFNDTKGGVVLEEGHSQQGNIFVNVSNATDGKDMTNTLGHEVYETYTLQTDGTNDASQEVIAGMVGEQLGNRIDRAMDGNLAQVGTNNLAGTTTVQVGTNAANAVGNAQVDHRSLNSEFAVGLPSYIERKKAQGDMQGVQAAEVLLILSALSEIRGPTDNLNAEIDQLNAEALGVSPESLEAAKQLPDSIKQRIVTMEPSDLCEGTACYVAAEVVDGMIKPESMTDVAVEYVGGALIGAGVDTYRAVKAGSKAADEIASATNAATDRLVGVRAEGDFGKLPPNQKYYEIETTSGTVIKSVENKTTTVLGAYIDDTRNIIDDQLILAKNPDYTVANPGGFNVLNVPDNMYKTPDQFWDEVNKPFLEAAIKREDEIYLATKPIYSRTDQGGNIYKADGTLTGFGREIEFLTNHGYVYDPSIGRMIKK